MTAPGSKRSRLLLVVALLLSLVLAGLVGVARWRRSQPRVLQVSFGSWSPGVEPALLGPEVSFVGFDRLLVAERFRDTESDTNEYEGQVWSIESGEVERTLRPFPKHEPGSTHGLWPGAAGEHSALVDLTTGAVTRLSFATDLASSLTSAGDLVAILDSDRTTAELRATRDGSLVRAVALPKFPTAPGSPSAAMPPQLYLSPRGDRLAAAPWGFGQISACDLATGAWWTVGAGEVLGFAPSGVISRFVHRKPRAPELATPLGERRPLCETGPSSGFRALSESGEVIATIGFDHGFVVRRVATGEAVRSIPLPPGREVECVALSPEGDRVAVAFEDGRVEVWALP